MAWINDINQINTVKVLVDKNSDTDTTVTQTISGYTVDGNPPTTKTNYKVTTLIRTVDSITYEYRGLTEELAASMITSSDDGVTKITKRASPIGGGGWNVTETTEVRGAYTIYSTTKQE